MSSITLRIEPALKRFVEQSAKKDGETVSTWLRKRLVRSMNRAAQ